MAKKRKKKLAPLTITCTSADCENGLHCLKPTRKMRLANELGNCRYCDMKLVDFKTLHKRNLKKADRTFEALKHEMWRHYFWHVQFDKRATNYAKRKGTRGIRDAAANRIRKYLKANNPWDGRQTGRTGNALFYAQHATATCCRGCMEYWHGIPRDRPLTDTEIDYAVELMMSYVDERIPGLTADGEKVPPIRRKKGSE